MGAERGNPAPEEASGIRSGLSRCRGCRRRCPDRSTGPSPSTRRCCLPKVPATISVLIFRGGILAHAGERRSRPVPHASPQRFVSEICRAGGAQTVHQRRTFLVEDRLLSVPSPGTDSRVTTAVGMNSLAAKILVPHREADDIGVEHRGAFPAGRLRNLQLRLARRAGIDEPSGVLKPVRIH